jgi:hypothetical protein
VILLFDVWRPELSAQERTLVQAMFSAIDAHSGQKPAWEISPGWEPTQARRLPLPSGRLFQIVDSCNLHPCFAHQREQVEDR